MCGIFFFSLLNAQSKSNSVYIKFKDTKYNFGFVKQGTIVKTEYFFENTGKTPLIISNIEVTCGCTIAEFPHHPIRQGESGMILITFNTKEKYDRQNRTVEVISNASNSPTKLRFKGVVLEDKPSKKKE
ncbi:MAG: DUF1573 domain-containing protein [Bacteroidetes bacterium]|nr:MAG: DUF1573 domain-containing protein [Bacteroidota bacterium]